VAAASVELDGQAMARLDAVLPPDAVAGERYRPEQMALVDR